MNHTALQFHKFAKPATEQMFNQRIHSTLFGELTISRRKIIHFPTGIPGLEQVRSYTFLDIEEYRPLVWMVSTCGKYHFPVIPIAHLDAESIDEHSKDNYLPLLTDIMKQQPMSVAYVILRLEPEIKQVSLKAPIIVHLQEQRGEQLILENMINEEFLVA